MNASKLEDVLKAVASWGMLAEHRVTIRRFIRNIRGEADKVRLYGWLFVHRDLAVVLRDRVLGPVLTVNALFGIVTLVWLAYVLTHATSAMGDRPELFVLALVAGLLALVAGIVWPFVLRVQLANIESVDFGLLTTNVTYREDVAEARGKGIDPDTIEVPADFRGDDELEEMLSGPATVSLSMLIAPLVSTGVMALAVLALMTVLGQAGIMSYGMGIAIGALAGGVLFVSVQVMGLFVREGANAGELLGGALQDVVKEMSEPLLDWLIIGLESAEVGPMLKKLNLPLARARAGVFSVLESIVDGAFVLAGIMMVTQHFGVAVAASFAYVAFGLLLERGLSRIHADLDGTRRNAAFVVYVGLAAFFVIQLVNLSGMSSGGTPVTPVMLINRLFSEFNHVLVANLVAFICLGVISGIVWLAFRNAKGAIPQRVANGAAVTFALLFIGAGMRFVGIPPRLPLLGHGEGALVGNNSVPGEDRFITTGAEAAYGIASPRAYHAMTGRWDLSPEPTNGFRNPPTPPAPPATPPAPPSNPAPSRRHGHHAVVAATDDSNRRCPSVRSTDTDDERAIVAQIRAANGCP